MGRMILRALPAALLAVVLAGCDSVARVETQGLLSGVEDADFSQVVLDMTRAEQTLELAQATSVRLLSTSLLNFLR